MKITSYTRSIKQNSFFCFELARVIFYSYQLRMLRNTILQSDIHEKMWYVFLTEIYYTLNPDIASAFNINT